MSKNQYAVALGKLAKGHKKTVSESSIVARRKNLELARTVLKNTQAEPVKTGVYTV
jgi:hypothetical protein